MKVLLLESGVEGINRDVMGMPATAFDHHRTNIDWQYMSEPQKICCQSFENQVRFDFLCGFYFSFCGLLKMTFRSFCGVRIHFTFHLAKFDMVRLCAVMHV